MRAVILAAGRGQRLHPLTENRPKCLTELGGISLIKRQLQTLRGAGVTDIIIVTGYRHEMLALPGTRQIHNARWQTTNMVESLFSAEADFGDDLVVAYGDIVYEPRILDALLQSRHDISVIVDRQWRSYWELRFSDPLADAESLSLDEEGRITDIGGDVADIDDIQAQFVGLMRFRRNGVHALRETNARMGNPPRPWMDRRPVAQAYMTDLLMEMILTGNAVHAVPVDGGWLEIDTDHDLELARGMVVDDAIERAWKPAPEPTTA